MRRVVPRGIINAFALLVVPIICGAESPKQPLTSFTVETDNIPRARIAAWYLPAHAPAKGTVFMAHGFRNSKQLLVPCQWIRDEQGWNMVLFDFRNHGDSSQTGLPTLGYYEQWDLKAMIDWAEAHRLAKPYVCFGVSMGAAISLRWAGQDSRISGVMANSPYRSAWDAVHQFHFNGHPMGALPSLVMHGGFKQMLQEVCIPDAVSKRNDLRIWITVGEHDWFPVSDEQAILDASPSPASLKRLEIIPGVGHAQQWKWPPNDQFIRDFLAESRQRTAGTALDETDGTLVLVAIAIAVALGRRVWKRGTPDLR